MRTRVALLACLLMLLGATIVTPPARAASSVSVSFFYDALSPYGDWLVSADFGYVWRPARVSVGWRPYFDGEWVYTDYGWTMLSDEPWGWAAYHYGRWWFDPRYGWIWIPGTEWAPAWVVFHHGGGFIGWAPLPPDVSFGVAFGGGVRVDPRWFCFVDERHFLDPRVGRRVLPSSRNVTLVRTTVNVTRYSRSGSRWINRSVPVDRIERVTARRIERRRIVDVAASRAAGRPQVHADRVALFRPQINSRVTHPPAKLRHESAPVTRRESGLRSQSGPRSQPEARYQAAPAGKRAPVKGPEAKRADDKKKKKGPPPPRH